MEQASQAILQDTREQIRTSDAFILAETRRLQTLYALKYEIRYARTRGALDTESVAEHVYGMLMLIEYFLLLEDEMGAWNHERIARMALFHDIDEIETGDTLGYLKTQANIDQERAAAEIVIQKLPALMREHTHALLDEYEAQETIEARFTKAIDKIEPLFHLYNKEGKRLLLQNGTTYEQSERIKRAYIGEFPYMVRFLDVIHGTMRNEGYFAEEA